MRNVKIRVHTRDGDYKPVEEDFDVDSWVIDDNQALHLYSKDGEKSGVLEASFSAGSWERVQRVYPTATEESIVR